MTLSGFVAYVKQLWANKPNTSSPLSAERINHIEEGIKTNSDGIEALAAAVIDQIVNDPNKIASAAALYSVKQAVDETNSDLTATKNDLVWKSLGNVTDAEYKILPNKYNDLEIIILHGATASSIRLSPLSISQWAGKQVALSFRYYDSSLKKFKFVDTTIGINASATGIAILTVTVDDAITSDYICTAFYR